MNLSNSNKLIVFEIKKLGFWDEIRNKMKGKWFMCVRNEDMKIYMLILGAFRA